MAFVWLPVALCVCFLLPKLENPALLLGTRSWLPSPEELLWQRLSWGSEGFGFRNGVGFVVWLPRRYKRSIFFPRSWVPRELCVLSMVKFQIPHYRAQEELEILRAGQFERVSWPCPWIIPSTNALCAQRPVRRRYFVPRSIGAGINRILLFPRTDDSLTAWCGEEGSLQTSRREPWWAAEGNEACPAVIVLIALGSPRDGAGPSRALSLAKQGVDSYFISVGFCD